MDLPETFKIQLEAGLTAPVPIDGLDDRYIVTSWGQVLSVQTGKFLAEDGRGRVAMYRRGEKRRPIMRKGKQLWEKAVEVFG